MKVSETKAVIYPIVGYGVPVLREKALTIPESSKEEIAVLIENMYETMYGAGGVGLAAPQIGKGIRLFVVDAEGMDPEKLQGFKKAFINAEMIEEYGDSFKYEEGCLSIPGIHGEVERPSKIRLKYFNEQWEEKEEVFEGLAARVIQHEYDHIEGKLFIDYLSPLKKRLIKSKLNGILNGETKVSYRMTFAKKMR